ncbi:MAG: hypothetical protein K5669_05035 [Lachnospiraceae bacterium]|nr:hypothetical protein [Lachnospiraceae bacterium]
MAINDTKVGGVSPADVPKGYKLSKLSLTFGIMSLVLLPIFSVPGLILGIMAFVKEKEAKKFYVPGIVTSAVSVALVIIVFVLFRVILAVFGLTFKDLTDVQYCMEVIADFVVEHS